MGVGSFLLQTVQLLAVAQGFSCNLYLQSNMATTAASYYEHRGFVKADSNEIMHLPETLAIWCQQAKKENASTPFVYFVTDDDMIQDAIRDGADPDAPENRAKFMHLLKLEGLLKLTGNSPDVMNPTAVQHCLPDRKDSTDFLRFPFSDTGLQLNLACTDLFLFDHLWFKFKEGRDNALREPIEDSGAYKTVLLYVDAYLMLKNDVMNPDHQYRYTQWLGGDHLDFFGYWMLRNKQSPVVQATTIVDTKVTTCIQNFF